MKKNLLIAAIAITALASCSSDEFVGEQSPQTSSGTNGAINFNLSTAAVTRAPYTGATAAGMLNNNFVVFGYKTVSGDDSKVFDNYQVNYVDNSGHTTESNSAGWEYVGYKNLPFGTTTTSGGTLNTDGVSANATASSTNIEQSIKYWDFNATTYDFFAYSLGSGNASTWAKASAMSNSTYTLEGTAAQLGTCYISNKETGAPSTSATEVNLEFRSFLSKIELQFYETIPGYSVKDIKFYPSGSGAASTTPYLYTSGEVFPTGGKYTVTFDAAGKAQLELATSDPTPTKTTQTTAFSTTLSNYKGAEYQEASASYLGRASNDATATDIISMLPNPQNAAALNLKIDFTLVSRDGTGETIEMKGATAVIPAAYAKWQPNYKYTYIFKISDNTNAQTGLITGLYPITLDAVVTDAVDGTQETITTVSDPSITTYAKGEMVTAKNEYLTGANIYIIVDNGTALTADDNAKLYKATIEDGAAQGITEETVANALVNGTHDGDTWTVTDALGKNLVVTTASGLTDITAIAADDAPDGHAITAEGVKFTPTAPTFTAVESGTAVTSGTTYYTAADGSTKVTLDANGTAGENQYWTKTASRAGYYVFEYIDGSSNRYYKVIKVVDQY